MFPKYKLSFLLPALVIMAACEKEPSDSYKETQNLEGNNIIVNSNSSELSLRIKMADEIMRVEEVNDSRLKSFNEPPKVDLNKNYTFKLRAEVSAPQIDGHTLMATHVKLHDKYAFVTYNTKGDKYMGGLEVFDVSDVSNPKIIHQALFKNADISSIDYYNNKLYITGATDIASIRGTKLRTPAMLGILSLNDRKEIIKLDTILNLHSYTGTDVKVTEEGIYATSGSNGFLKVFNHNYELVFSSSIPDARSVDMNINNAYVLNGQPGKISVISRNNHSLIKTISPGGATIPESKSEIAANDNYIFSALNEGGLKVYKTDGTFKQHILRPATPTGMRDEDYVTNSVSLNGDLVVIGNGQAGLYVGGIVNSRNDSIFLLGSIKFKDYESANFVESKDSVIFVATGLGGLKILSISIDEGVPDDIIPTKPCTTLSSTILSLFPEGKNNYNKYPDLFQSHHSKHVVLTKESEVFITFIEESAGWKNSLGYYTYSLSDPPNTVEELKKHILFPNVSKVNNGGGLNTGDMLQIGTGKFPANTVIGFYLITQGWKNGLIDKGRYTQYTDVQFNIGTHQQHTLFIEKNCNNLVLTFEDINRDDPLSYNDKDFNDLIFTISDNKDPNHSTANTAFDLTNIQLK